MEQINTTPGRENVLMTAVTAVLYFCAILVFAYQFTM